MKPIKNPFAKAQDLAAKKVIKQFAHKFGLVFFGQVSHHEAEQLVRGVTASAKHVDNNYAVGSIHHYDLTLVDRRDELTFPGKTSRSYRWVIAQFDLKHSGQPHVFIEGSRHEEIFFANLFIKHAQFHNAGSLFAHHDPLFARNFKVFTAATVFSTLESVLTQEVTSMLAHHFDQFDYEIDDDRLYVYISNPPVVTPNMLAEMIRVGVWLAGQLDGLKNDLAI